MAMSDEEYRRLDEQYSARRAAFDSKVWCFSLLEKVIDGHATFGERADDLDRQFHKQAERRLLPPDYWDGFYLWRDIVGFHRMITRLSSAEIPLEEELMGEVLMGTTRMEEEYRRGFDDTMHQLSQCSKSLDSELRTVYAPSLFSKNPVLFAGVFEDMPPAERDYARRKVLENLDAEYSAFGETIASLSEQHYFVNRIAEGKSHIFATFAVEATMLRNGFRWLLPSRSERMKLSSEEFEERCRPYEKKLFTFTRVVDALTGERVDYDAFDFDEAVIYTLRGKTPEIVGRKWDAFEFIYGEFERYIALSERLDKKIALVLAPRFVTAQPELFRQAYVAAHPIEREYVRERLLKALGAGAVRDMSEDELLKFLDN